MRLGQIGCGRQNPPIQSAELASSRIGMVKGINEPSELESGNRSIASLETQMVRRRWIPVYSGSHETAALRPGCLYPSRWLPWLRRCALRTQVCLKLMIIRVNLQFLYRRPNQYKRKLSEWDIYIYILLNIILQLRYFQVMKYLHVEYYGFQPINTFTLCFYVQLPLNFATLELPKSYQVQCRS
ncbi:Hypothetical_protein [Hexamita inflata]|uniref:Hypothetical_protein n=1 Tax=Hexamita inflata TaxID=28002 RepID=A0AA86QPH4_9EUKA|nr:Hypothetical protein HINF_LOCUS45607 [Hexamita inflata]